jgi:hypothetical protein
MTKKSETARKSLPSRTCRYCGWIFVPKRKGQIYHTTECRKADYRSRAGYPEVTKVCLNPACSGTFTTTLAKKQHYCSPDCRRAARKARDAEKRARWITEQYTYIQEVANALHNASYKCSKCGKVASPTVKLLVVPSGAALTVVCEQCKEKS